MPLGELARCLFSFFANKPRECAPDYRVLPPVVEFRSLVRDGAGGFLVEEPLAAEAEEFFAPPADCRTPPDRAPAARGLGPDSRLLTLRRAGEDPLELGDLFENPQELLLGLFCFFDEEVCSHLAQVEYHPQYLPPETPPSPLLLLRTRQAAVSGRNKERLLVAATVLARYLPPAMQERLERGLLRLLDALETHQPSRECEPLESIDLENIRRAVAAIERAPNRYWQVLTLVQSLRGMIAGVQRRLGAEIIPVASS